MNFEVKTEQPVLDETFVKLTEMDHGLSKDFLLGLSNFIEATINKKVNEKIFANSQKMNEEIVELK